MQPKPNKEEYEHESKSHRAAAGSGYDGLPLRSVRLRGGAGGGRDGGPGRRRGEAEAALPGGPGPSRTRVGVLSFENLDSRLRENNYNLLALEETIASIEVLDYDKMYDSLKKQLNEIADYQWMLIQFGQGNSYSSAMLPQNYSAVRDTFDAIKDGELQQDNA